MAIVMNMSGYEIEREEAAVGRYDDEMKCAGWNPQVGQVALQAVEPIGNRRDFPAELVYVDVEVFLDRMYKFQR